MTEAVPSGRDGDRAGREGRRAPDDGAVKVTMPPATGSIGLLAVTTTASGLAKAVPSVVCCGVLPATGVRVKPWLWKAPMSGGESSGSPRWSVVTPLDGRAGADGRAAGQEGHGLGRAAVVAQRGQAQVGEAGQDDVAVAAVRRARPSRRCRSGCTSR